MACYRILGPPRSYTRLVAVLSICLCLVLLYMSHGGHPLPSSQTVRSTPANSQIRASTHGVGDGGDGSGRPGPDVPGRLPANVRLTHYEPKYPHRETHDLIGLGSTPKVGEKLADTWQRPETMDSRKASRFAIYGNPPGAPESPVDRFKESIASEENSDYSEYGGYASVSDVPKLDELPIRCELLFKGSNSERQLATNYQYDSLVGETGDHSNINWQKVTSDCTAFRSQRGYLSKPVSPEEEEFPLAYGVAIYKDTEQVERLLRSIYRPQNHYCLHVDKKATPSVMQDMASIANCFPNVFLSSRSVEVHWGFFSVVESDIICMDELVKYKTWKYFINLTGQEFPLKTNLDIVKILKTFHGANDIAGSPMNKMSKATRQRIEFVHQEGQGKTDMEKAPFPHNMTMAKGSVHVVASRDFVEYVANDPVALEFREWCRDTGHASEHFFNSLEYSPGMGVPGAYTGTPNEKMSVARWKEWSWYGYKCQGKFVRSICIIGVGDLPALYDTEFLFVNKLHFNYHPLAYSCLEELLYNRTREEILGLRQFDVQLYAQLPFVQDRLRVMQSQQKS